MQLHGLHHITMITGDAQRNVAFWADTMGLRFVKKTVNFDAPEAYHLYFGDERGAPGSILTWFEFAGAAPGHAGDGMVHTIQLGVPSEAALGFWADRLAAAGRPVDLTGTSLKFTDPDGLGLELVVADERNAAHPLRAEHPEVGADVAITGVEGARAFGQFHAVREGLLTDVLGFEATAPGEYRLQGPTRGVTWAYDQPVHQPRPGAGTVHHIAWAAPNADHLGWQARVAEAGGFVTDVKDRDYFDAIYFREPRGVLFEIATLDPGFAVDEDAAHLGEALRLPPQHEHLRSELERTLRPVDSERTKAGRAAEARA